jgi:hypothetical protein
VRSPLDGSSPPPASPRLRARSLSIAPSPAQNAHPSMTVALAPHRRQDKNGQVLHGMQSTGSSLMQLSSELGAPKIPPSCRTS